MDAPANKSGSIWRRWDPHIHGPGTVLNDQFGVDSWDQYFDRVEAADPPIQAIGITDYYVLDSYEQMREQRRSERMPQVGFIFPNIELRFGIGTDKGGPVNFHLLINPEDEEHIERTRLFLRKLTYKFADHETYQCTRDDLIRLGRAHESKDLDEKAALKAGANQFKVSVDEFLEQWNDDAWIQKNALIAVPASSRDGTSGLQKDKSLSSLRKKIETAAHIIFSSQEKQRQFWLGDGVLSADEIQTNYNGLKPCLHGSDAHDLEKVGEPDLNRYCWLKGDACFETLRQACIEPRHRVAIGETPPEGAYISQTITNLEMSNADWFSGGSLTLNGGLIGIIGARGSGKSALADMIAAGGYDLSSHVSDSSFVSRAQEYLTDAEAKLTWADGQTTSNGIAHTDIEDILDSPRIRYLSQKFVERLCSAKGATEELIAEINRVIFDALPEEDRLDSEDFDDLLNVTSRQGRDARALHREQLSGLGARVAEQRNKKDGLAQLTKDKTENESLVKRLIEERKKLVPKDATAHAAAYEKVNNAAGKIRTRIEQARRRLASLDTLETYVKSIQATMADQELEQLKVKHSEAGILDTDWVAFKRVFFGDPIAVIKSARKTNNDLVNQLSGPPATEVSDPNAPPKDSSLIPKDADLLSLPLSLLSQEEDRLNKLIGADEAKRRRHRRLSQSISQANKKIETLSSQIKEAEEADKKIADLLKLRTRSYAGVFDGIVAEEDALEALYEPLRQRLASASGALGSLTFSVKRHVDLHAWAKQC